MALSNFCHLLSVLVIYSLSKTIFAQASESRSLIPIATAALHIINPAGAFLLAPYTEALFSFLHISGFQLYFWGLRDRLKHKSLRSDVQILAAGAVFGISTTVRSNGLLSGALFLYDAIHVMLSLLSNTLSVEKCKQLACFGIGGCLVGLGTIIPQWNAYTRYCTPGPNYGTRPWCNDSVPSIYAWVQRHYWYDATHPPFILLC